MKGIAIQTILMLLVGILVVGILVYMVYLYMFAPGLDMNDCRTQLVSWCTTCRTVGWVGGFDLSSNVADCTEKYFGHTMANAPALVNCGENIGTGAAACTSGNCPNTTICAAVGVGTTT